MCENCSRNKTSGTKKLVAGLAIGAAAGMVAGILTAPKSGKETRADLAKKAKDIKGKVSNKAGDLKNRTTQFGKEAKESWDRNMMKARKDAETRGK